VNTLVRVLAAFAVVFAFGSPREAAAGRIPMYQLYNSSFTDFFYTADASQRDLAISCCGYFNYGPVFYVDDSPGATGQPFQRFFIGAPLSEHFYTISPSEASYVVNQGYVYERVEGYVQPAPILDAVPLYRLAMFPGPNDILHYYTSDQAAYNAILASGWWGDGIVGYVYTNPNPPPLPATFVSEAIPTTMSWGQSASVEVAFQNNSSATWTPNIFGLKRTSENSSVWNVDFVPLTAPVGPNETATFRFTITAKCVPSGCNIAVPKNFQWQMANGSTLFGAASPADVITVGPGSMFDGSPPGPAPAFVPYVQTTSRPYTPIPPDPY